MYAHCVRGWTTSFPHLGSGAGSAGCLWEMGRDSLC